MSKKSVSIVDKLYYPLFIELLKFIEIQFQNKESMLRNKDKKPLKDLITGYSYANKYLFKIYLTVYKNTKSMEVNAYGEGTFHKSVMNSIIGTFKSFIENNKDFSIQSINIVHTLFNHKMELLTGTEPMLVEISNSFERMVLSDIFDDTTLMPIDTTRVDTKRISKFETIANNLITDLILVEYFKQKYGSNNDNRPMEKRLEDNITNFRDSIIEQNNAFNNIMDITVHLLRAKTAEKNPISLVKQINDFDKKKSIIDHRLKEIATNNEQQKEEEKLDKENIFLLWMNIFSITEGQKDQYKQNLIEFFKDIPDFSFGELFKKEKLENFFFFPLPDDKDNPNIKKLDVLTLNTFKQNVKQQLINRNKEHNILVPFIYEFMRCYLKIKNENIDFSNIKSEVNPRLTKESKTIIDNFLENETSGLNTPENHTNFYITYISIKESGFHSFCSFIGLNINELNNWIDTNNAYKRLLQLLMNPYFFNDENIGDIIVIGNDFTRNIDKILIAYNQLYSYFISVLTLLYHDNLTIIFKNLYEQQQHGILILPENNDEIIEKWSEYYKNLQLSLLYIIDYKYHSIIENLKSYSNIFEITYRSDDPLLLFGDSDVNIPNVIGPNPDQYIILTFITLLLDIIEYDKKNKDEIKYKNKDIMSEMVYNYIVLIDNILLSKAELHCIYVSLDNLFYNIRFSNPEETEEYHQIENIHFTNIFLYISVLMDITIIFTNSYHTENNIEPLTLINTENNALSSDTLINCAKNFSLAWNNTNDITDNREKFTTIYVSSGSFKFFCGIASLNLMKPIRFYFKNPFLYKNSKKIYKILNLWFNTIHNIITNNYDIDVTDMNEIINILSSEEYNNISSSSLIHKKTMVSKTTTETIEFSKDIKQQCDACLSIERVYKIESEELKNLKFTCKRCFEELNNLLSHQHTMSSL